VTSLSLRTWPPDFPDDIAVQRRTPYEARADAIMYRQEIGALALARQWMVHRYVARTVVAEATERLGARADDVLMAPRTTLGSLDQGSPRRARRDRRRGLTRRDRR
jgi:hypothetical protein